MKTFFTRSISILIACFVVVLGSCVDTIIENAHAAMDQAHEHQEFDEFSETASSDSTEHEHSDGEHCVEVDLVLHNNLISLQKSIFNDLLSVLPEHFLHPANKLYVGLEMYYESGFLVNNTFQRHIRSVLMRV